MVTVLATGGVTGRRMLPWWGCRGFVGTPDPTNAQWELIEALLPAPDSGGRPPWPRALFNHFVERCALVGTP